MHGGAPGSRQQKQPIQVCWDFQAAFPSVAHLFVHIALMHAGLPRAWREFFKALYEDNEIVKVTEEGLIIIYMVAVGVLQGCP